MGKGKATGDEMSTQNDREKRRRLQALAALVRAAAVKAAEIMHACTVPLVGRVDGKFGVVGSGVLFELGDKAFILTASHVVEVVRGLADRGVPVEIPTGEPGGPAIPLFELRTHYSVPGGGFREDLVDVAFVELPAKVARRLQETKRFLHQTGLDLADRGQPDGWYAVHGYPEETLEQRDAEKAVILPALHLVTRVYRGQRGAIPTPRAQFDFSVDFVPKNSADLNGNPVSVPAPRGVSGCGIWRFARGPADLSRWEPAMLKLVAVEHTWNRELQILRGTPVGHIFRQILQSHEALGQLAGILYAGRGW
jgi:hypothetical protein